MKRMKIGILGTGDVGQALGKGLVGLGHEVRMGSRDVRNAKAAAWSAAVGGDTKVGTFAEVVDASELLVLATLGHITEEMLRGIGPEKFAGKILIDTTNPIQFVEGQPPSLFVGTTDSLGERVQRLLPECHVVKAFNTVGHAHMVYPKFKEGRPDMFIAGNDGEAKGLVTKLCATWGWGVIDLGDITVSRYLEPMCMTWILFGVKNQSWSHAFKLLKK